MIANGTDFDPTARVHVTQGVATSVSTDGSTALLRFKTATDGSDLEITFPASAIKVLATMVQDLITAAGQRKVGIGNVQPRRPKGWFVGASDQDRGTVYLMFDCDTTHEVIVAICDDDAIDLSAALRAEAFSHMTPQQRAKRLGELATLSPKRLILPRLGG